MPSSGLRPSSASERSNSGGCQRGGGVQANLARDAAERELEVKETWDRGRDTEYRYDEDGNLSRRRVDGRFQEGAYQGGRLTTFEYDPLGRERRMAVSDRPEDPESQSRDWTTSYHPSGEIDVLQKPNGTTERHFFRADGLIESIRRETEAPGEEADKDVTYAYDSNSNRTKDERGTYAYNARDQLVLWDPEGQGEGNEPTSYVVNGSGQISEQRSPELRSTYTYAGHRLSERKDDYSDPLILDATYRYRYDDFGNTTRIRGPGAGTSEPPPDITGACEGAANWIAPDTAYFCWDEFSRLNTSKGAETNRSAGAVYVHDGLDRRDFRITQGNGASELRREYSYVGLSELLALDATQIYTQVSLRKLAATHAATHPGRPMRGTARRFRRRTGRRRQLLGALDGEADGRDEGSEADAAPPAGPSQGANQPPSGATLGSR